MPYGAVHLAAAEREIIVVVVHVRHHHAAAHHRLVPAFLLHVFHDIVFMPRVVVVVEYAVCLAAG